MRLALLSIGLAIGAVGCFTMAIGLWASSALSQRRTAAVSPIGALAQTSSVAAVSPAGGAGDDSQPDPWEDAEAAYPGLALWLEVGGMGISTPVMAATADAPDWFLDHDALGDESPSGLPYLDYRCEPLGDVRTIYAHNLGWGASGGFGSLADAWRQDAFDAIGDLTLASPPRAAADALRDAPSTSDSRTMEAFHPLCAMKVEPDDDDVVRPDDGHASIDAWLERVLDSASASARDAEAGAMRFRRVVVLVTCSGDGYPSRSRTAVVFVDDAVAPGGIDSQSGETDGPPIGAEMGSIEVEGGAHEVAAGGRSSGRR